jgi:hypothetical protein
MKLIKPIPFQASHLISSNAVETYTAWNIATTYAKDAFVDYGTYIYQSLVNGNEGKQPDTSPAQWQLVGPDNTHAMFDNQVSTQTTSTAPLIVTVQPLQIFNSLAFFNLDGTELIVNVYDGSNPIPFYTKTVDLDDTIITDWYDYFFEPYDIAEDCVLTDIPPYMNAKVTMTLSKPSGSVSIGNFVYGNVYTLGLTQYGASAGIKDYSVKETDEFGNTTFVERPFSKRMQANVIIEKSKLNQVNKLLSSVRAVPTVWIGSEDNSYKNTVVFGFYRDFSIEIAYPTFNMMSLEIEGLI